MTGPYVRWRDIQECREIEVLAKLQGFPQESAAVEPRCSNCRRPHVEHVRLAAGIDMCPDTWFVDARPAVESEPAADPGDVGSLRVSWFAIAYGAAAGLYLLGLGLFVEWVLSW